VLALAGSEARADAFNLRLEETFGAQRAHFVDASGATTDTNSLAFAQRYRLSLDRSVYESVRLSLAGTYEEPRVWSSGGGISNEFVTRRWNGDANLAWGGQALSGSLTYSRHQERSEAWTTTEGQPRSFFGSPKLESEAYAAFLGWRPIDLPTISLRVARMNEFDSPRETRDSTTDTASVTAEYQPAKPIDFGYTAGYTDSVDRLHGSELTGVSQAARVAYHDRWFGRTTTFISYNVANSVQDVSTHGLGGEISTPRPPAAGLSLVETFPATPTLNTLTPNPALVDGSVTDSAGINLGFSRSLAGDTVPRDVGLQFTEPVKPLNTLFVWVDKQLPSEVSSAVVWTAYQSSDNQTWTPLTVTKVVFGLFVNRFEITIQQTTAKYVKVVARPVAFSATADPRYADIFVTEVQAFLVVPAATVAGRSTSTNSGINATATTRILDSPSLMHDVSFTLGSSGVLPLEDPGWTLTNGLGVSHRFNPTLTGGARVSRSDQGGSIGHLGQWSWGGSLAAEPLPSLGAGFSYGGTETDSSAGIRLSNNVAFNARADLYKGVGLSGNSGYGITRDEKGRLTKGFLGSSSLGIAPNKILALNASYSVSRSTSEGGGLPDSFALSQQFGGGLVLTPFPSLTATGSVTRLLATGFAPQTLASIDVGFSPFRGGAIVLGANHTESFQLETQQLSRQTSASLTWKVRPGTNLDAGYTLSETQTPAERATAQSVNARLTVSL
jgi:hypothetical protein